MQSFHQYEVAAPSDAPGVSEQGRMTHTVMFGALFEKLLQTEGGQSYYLTKETRDGTICKS